MEPSVSKSPHAHGSHVRAEACREQGSLRDLVPASLIWLVFGAAIVFSHQPADLDRNIAHAYAAKSFGFAERHRKAKEVFDERRERFNQMRNGKQSRYAHRVREHGAAPR